MGRFCIKNNVISTEKIRCFGIFESICQTTSIISRCYSPYCKTADSDRCFQTFLLTKNDTEKSVISIEEKDYISYRHDQKHRKWSYIDRKMV